MTNWNPPSQSPLRIRFSKLVSLIHSPLGGPLPPPPRPPPPRPPRNIVSEVTQRRTTQERLRNREYNAWIRSRIIRTTRTKSGPGCASVTAGGVAHLCKAPSAVMHPSDRAGVAEKPSWRRRGVLVFWALCGGEPSFEWFAIGTLPADVAGAVACAVWGCAMGWGGVGVGAVGHRTGDEGVHPALMAYKGPLPKETALWAWGARDPASGHGCHWSYECLGWWPCWWGAGECADRGLGQKYHAGAGAARTLHSQLLFSCTRARQTPLLLWKA